MKFKVIDVEFDFTDSQGELEGFGNLPKDNEGTETTIFECLDNCITQLLEEQRTKWNI